MNVNFSCSITGGRDEEVIYQAIVNEMEALGHTVPTAHLSSSQVMDLEKIGDPVEIFERDMAWLRACDAVVAEVSSPSHGVGYEIAYALSLKKPVLCCHLMHKPISKIISGNTTPGLTVVNYTLVDEVLLQVRAFLGAVPAAQA